MVDLIQTLPQPPVSIGRAPWTREELLGQLQEFEAVYRQRPVQDNYGGMSSSHLFLFWALLRNLKPKTVIENGVWKGQGTWLIEQAVPDANVISIDINWNNLVYRSRRVDYRDVDFTKQDWSGLDTENALVFFDDHVDAFARTKQCAERGFKHIVFEDNYFPPSVSDLYTLKLAFAGAGYKAPNTLRYWGGRIKGTRSDVTVKPNFDDAATLRDMLAVYEELPPVFLPSINRWGIAADTIPTPAPLLDAVTEPWQQVYADECMWYTWIAYARLK
jgi:hypothetical protein